ncbi:MAG: RagB/SusD family nutrient uptake outer membrane protein [Balneolales bacterium]|nr:RagB/SusD family nutrient uptake outer membrane protein [Balneolales bacterium]
MKKHVLTGALMILLVSISGCDDQFLNTVPTEDVSDELVTATPANMMLGINGIHRSLYQRYLSCQGCVGLGALMIFNDAMGEDVVMTRTSSTWHYGLYQWNVHRNASARDNRFPWLFYYQIIRNANVIINGEDNADGDQSAINIPIGQALTYRAFAHYQLVQLYADRYDAASTNSHPGIPVVIEVSNAGQARASVEDVYRQIHDDLEEAANRLQGYNRPNKSHLDRSVALGLRARVYLTQQNWTEAASFAAQARAGYTLMSETELLGGFNDYTIGEWMWGTGVVLEQTDRFGHFGANMSRNNSTIVTRTNPRAINTLLYDQISDTDVRQQWFDPTGQHPDLNLPSAFAKFPYTHQKFLAASEDNAQMDVPYMRAAEMYLIEAEARARLNDPTAADVLLSLVSTRDPSYVRSLNVGQALVDEVLIHRRIELWGEGFRFLDLKRLNQALDRTGANHGNAQTAGVFEVPAGSEEWTYLIPQAEVDANPNINSN